MIETKEKEHGIKTFLSNKIKHRVKQFHKEILAEGRNGHRIKDRSKVLNK